MDHTFIHFEIPANNLEKLKKFYEEVFAWKFTKASMGGPIEYWTIETVPVDKNMKLVRPGVNGGMYPKQTTPESKPVSYISVESIDEYTEKIKKQGGKIISPKMEIPTIGWWALAVDPEGNPFGLLEPMVPQPKTRRRKV